MRKRINLFTILILLLVSGCEKQDEIKQQEIIDASKNTIEIKEVELSEIKAENRVLEETIVTLQNEINNLQKQINEYSLNIDKLAFLQENTYILQTVLENFESNLPQLDYGDNEFKKKILEEIDFHSDKIELEKDELMLAASIVHEVGKDTNEVLVECTIYNKLKNINDGNSIDYIKMMFIRAERVNEKWEVVGFQRSH